MSKTNEIKKYPVFYNGKEYEIRIEKPYLLNWDYRYYITIYKVKKYFLCYKKYNRIFFESLDNVLRQSNADNFDKNYYIKLFKYTFKTYLDSIQWKLTKEEIKNKQLTALQEWDGIIE